VIFISYRSGVTCGICILMYLSVVSCIPCSTPTSSRGWLDVGECWADIGWRSVAGNGPTSGVQIDLDRPDIDNTPASWWRRYRPISGYPGYIGKILVIERIWLAIMVAYRQQYGTILALSWVCYGWCRGCTGIVMAGGNACKKGKKMRKQDCQTTYTNAFQWIT
jgi:hypothetical protein